MQFWKVSGILAFLVFSEVFAVEKTKTSIAVMDFSGVGVDQSEAIVISNRIRNEFVNTGKYIVTERTRMQDILKEKGFQQLVCDEVSCIMDAGRILKVEQMVAGSVDKIGRMYSVNVRIVSVETGEIIKSAYDDCPQCSIEDFAIRSSQRVVATLIGSRATFPTSSQPINTGSTEKIAGPVSGMEFVSIPGGSFTMGSPSSEEGRYDNEGPLHQVTIQPFYMISTEVTQAQWKAVMNSNPSSFKGDNLPVETVSWYDCQEFIIKLNQMDPGKGYRLPTEAEWEYACRAGTTTRFHSGYSESDLARVGWYSGNSGSTTHPVGSKEPNAWGLYDMHGNAWEWCQDRYHANYFGAPTDGSAWESGGDPNRVLRGGSWFRSGEVCRSARRFWVDLGQRGFDLGFRILRSS